ncbi:MAG TPA: site-specific DNA-methyltransferase, partial [Candidatus Limnocylindrales bacterium]|nr:site-specific DNA-methyltransferase [Candidatus Limnocylindrales bacterium]
PVETTVHKDKRANIPTRELRDFVAEDENKPKTILYPRDPSLDPQLVWKGKDEQDAKDLAIPAVPVYIQEKIHPKYIIEDLRAQSKEGKPAQLDLFGDFNGIKFEEMVEFYQHDLKWSNRMILGDSLLVMTSLAEKERLKGKVQMIYIDPPYGINFGSNWQVSTRRRDVKDGKAEDATRQPEQVKAFRDTWKLGIHSYLAYLRDRLVVARDLLSETGSIFVQIGDENVHLVRCLLDEVFGSENFILVIVFQKTGGQSSKLIASSSDFILWYTKKKENVKYRQLFQVKTAGEGVGEQYRFVELANGEKRRMTTDELEDVSLLPSGSRIFRPTSIEADTPSDSTTFEFVSGDMSFEARSWKTNPNGISKLAAAERIMAVGKRPNYIRYLDDFPVSPLTDVWGDTMGARDLVYVVQTNTKIIERCLLMTTDPGDLVLDPTCGGGTTAYVAEQWGRRWITIDTSRVALALARTRLMSARFPYYLLADSAEGVKKEAEISGKVTPPYVTSSDIRKGFVYKKVPHVTLKSIANNPDIKEGMSRKEIDAAIARHADSETLYDQPYEDNKRVRVTGPFTVESLSPHRFVSLDKDKPSAETSAQKEDSAGQFEAMIIDNLKKAGVQNTIKNERLKFDRLEPFAGDYLQAEGEYTDKDGKSKRVAVFIGPQYGTVSPDMVKESAKSAVQGIGFDILVVCGFAFDPHVSEEAKRYGKLTVLVTHMNPDLSMGDELLKTTGSGNLFMVFGEPDVDIIKQKGGKYTVEIKGLDIYNPTTGQIRSDSTQDIACWFIDTDYNGESFFVRHAYFTDGENRYEKLKKTLKAEIDENVWSTLYATVSRPFDPPKTGKIAIKVINHYGDEVLKVYEVK